MAAVADNSWGEATITYNNAPAIGAQIGSSGPLAADSYVEIDVTTYVSQNGLLSFVLTPIDADRINIDSGEASNPPQLVIDFGE